MFDVGGPAAEPDPFAVDPQDDRDERFERAEVLIVLSAEAEMILEAFERKGLLGRRSCQ